jgi:probable HAF family extracellular repeat protein
MPRLVIHYRSVLLLLVAAALVTSRFAGADPPPQPGYTFALLEPPPGYDFSYAAAINNLGHVAGYVAGPAEDGTLRWRPALWRDGQVIELGTLGGQYSVGTDLNDLDAVVGQSHDVGGRYQAFVWREGEMTPLGPPAREVSYAAAINNLGDVVGSAYGSDQAPGLHAVLWQDGAEIDLGAPRNGYSVAFDINDAGDIVGHAVAEGRHMTRWREAVVWRRGTRRRLGVLPGDRHSEAVAINQGGTVLGLCEGRRDGAYVERPFLWRGKRPRPLDNVPRDEIWDARGLNDASQVVGALFLTFDWSVPFLWENGRVNRLDLLFPEEFADFSAEFRDINNAGQIIGNRQRIRGSDPYVGAFILTPAGAASLPGSAARAARLGPGVEGMTRAGSPGWHPIPGQQERNW